MWNKYCIPVQATDNIIRRMRVACPISKATDTLGICKTYCFSVTIMSTRTRLDAALYAHCLSCYKWKAQCEGNSKWFKIQTFIIISNLYFTIPSVRLLFNESCEWWTNSVGQSSLSICALQFIYTSETLFAHQRVVGLHSSFLTLRVWSVRFQCIGCLRFEVWDSCTLVVLPVQYMSRRTFVSLFKVQYEVKGSSWEVIVICLEPITSSV